MGKGLKYLFIVQGEGRGHLTQAMALEKLLTENGHQVVGILVGKSQARQLPEFFVRGVSAPVRQFDSVNFQPSSENRTVNMLRSVLYNIEKFPQYLKSILFLKDAIRDSEADVVVNFYELLTGITYFNFKIDIPNISIGHQYLFHHSDFHLGDSGIIGTEGLQIFTKITAIGAHKRLALSFRSMDDDEQKRIRVVPPILRESVLETEPSKGNYIHGYMLNSGFSEDVMKWHAAHPEVELRFFWDRWSETPVKRIDDTLSFYLLDDVELLKQMAGCMAFASTAGFESVCEAMYFGKPILMVPSHIEQRCNAFDAVRSGVGISSDFFDLSALLEFAGRFTPDPAFPDWARSARRRILQELIEL